MSDELRCPGCGEYFPFDEPYVRPNPRMPAFAMPRCPRCGRTFRVER